MLEITVPADVREEFNEETNEFIYTTVSKEQTLKLEHSLVSLQKWESKYCKPFLTRETKTDEETLDYIKFMTLTQNVSDKTYERLLNTNRLVNEILDYIEAPMTATTFVDRGRNKINNEQITAELVYYWMVALGIPSEYRKWHLNQLLTLIKVCNVKNQPTKKMNSGDINARNAALNAARKKQLNTKG